jgi:cell division septal protein FtsQ
MAKRPRRTGTRGGKSGTRGESKRVRKSGTPAFSISLGDRVVPLAICGFIVVCLAVIFGLTYETVAASPFFHLRTVDVHGADRASRTDIEKIVRANAERPGVWNAELLEIKQKIEKVTFVKSASVTRALPSGITVKVTERVPVAIVRIDGGEFLVDAEAEVLAPVEKPEREMPFAMLGWDEAKSERAGKENLERLKMYQKMIAEWRDYDLASRVKMVDLADLREPKAILEDSGLPVTIMLARDNFGRQLSSGIKAIVGKGNMFEGVNLVGQNMVLVPRKQQ